MYTRSSKLWLYGFETFFNTLSYVKDICDIDGQNTKHVFASKGTHAVYLNPKSSIALRYATDLESTVELAENVNT